MDLNRPVVFFVIFSLRTGFVAGGDEPWGGEYSHGQIFSLYIFFEGWRCASHLGGGGGGHCEWSSDGLSHIFSVLETVVWGEFVGGPGSRQTKTRVTFFIPATFFLTCGQHSFCL